MQRRALTALLAGGLGLAGAPAAQAQGDTQDKDASRARASGIEEIVVTARKREESLQQTPVAITAFTETDIQDRDIRQIQEITASVPSLQFDNATGSASSARLYLRGVGNGDPISSDDPGVGLYVDGVFLPRAQGAVLTVSDVQQVEVLRGPQGTLFGKNTIGGAISITTRKPDPSERFGSASVRYGNYDRFDTRFSYNLPLVPEKSALRLSFATATQDGVAKNKSTGRDFSDDKLLAGRAQIMFLPSDQLELNLSLDRSIENRAPIGGKCKVSNTKSSPSIAAGRIPNGVTVGEFLPGTSVTDPTMLVDNGMNGGIAGNGIVEFGEADANGNGKIDPAAAAVAFASAAQLTGNVAASIGTASVVNVALGGPFGANNLLASCIQDDARDERSIASDLTSSKNYLETWGTNATMVYDFGDLTLKSISSWRQNKNTVRIDNDYTELNFAQASIDAGNEIQDAFSQELQLTGLALDGRLKFAVGLYAFSEDIRGETPTGLSSTVRFPVATAFLVDPVLGVRDPATAVSLGAFSFSPNFAARFPRAATDATCAGVGAVAAATAPVGCISLFGAATRTTLRVKNYGYAGYTQATYDLDDQWSVTLGARLTAERKRARSRVVAITDGFVGARARSAGETDFDFNRAARFKDISPLVNLSYQATDDLMLYTTYSKGFKSGGFNGRANADQLTTPIDDEKLTSYEVGFKTGFFGNRVFLNGAAYWSIYEDIQLTIPMGLNGQASIAVLNAGEAEIKGGELELKAQVTDDLFLTGSFGVVNSRYTEFDDSLNLNAKDRRLLASPNYTGNVAATYTLPLGSMGDMRLRTEWTHRGSSGTDVVESEVLRKGKNGELDATMTLALADGATEITFFGTNLLNRTYFENGVNLDASLGIAYRFYNKPRMYGVELRRSF